MVKIGSYFRSDQAHSISFSPIRRGDDHEENHAALFVLAVLRANPDRRYHRRMKQILAALFAIAATSAHAEEMKLTPEMAKAATLIIQKNGFKCPAAKLAWKKGADARGDVVKVHCGPDDGTGDVFADFAYRVTFRDDGRIDVAEW